MHVIIFSWEYPPRVVGELAWHVRDLAVKSQKHKVNAHVVTYNNTATSQCELSEGISIHNISNPIKTHTGILTWILTLNQEVNRATANIYYSTKKQTDLIDVHDWHFIPAAITLKKAFNLPFVYSIESLEDHRSHGANSLLNTSIKSIEWLGMYEAEKVVVKSKWMQEEAIRIYNLPRDKIVAIQPKSRTWINDVIETYQDAIGGSSS